MLTLCQRFTWRCACLPCVYLFTSCVGCGRVLGGWRGLWCERGQKPHRTLILSLFFSLPPLFFFSLLFFFIPLSRETRGVRWGGKVHVDGDIQAQIKGPRGLRGCSFSGWLSPPCLRQLHSKHTLAKSATVGGKATSLSLSLTLGSVKSSGGGGTGGHWGGTKDSWRKMEWQSTQAWHFLCWGEKRKWIRRNSLTFFSSS